MDTHSAVADLARWKDEIRLKFKLLTLDARSKWNDLEKEMDQVEDRLLEQSGTGVTRSQIEGLIQSAKALVASTRTVTTAGDIMSPSVTRCRATDNLSWAAQLMWEEDCGVLPVVDDQERLIGVITDRDICMAGFTQGRALSECSVETAMTRDVAFCTKETSLEDVADFMRNRRIRRIVVVDDERVAVGVVSLSDIARSVDGMAPRDRGARLVLDTLNTICTPRSVAARSG